MTPVADQPSIDELAAQWHAGQQGSGAPITGTFNAPALHTKPSASVTESVEDVLKTHFTDLARVGIQGIGSALSAGASFVGADKAAKKFNEASKVLAPVAHPTTEAGVITERIESRFVNREVSQDKQIVSAINQAGQNGGAFYDAPMTSIGEFAWTPIQGLGHGITATLGWVTGVAAAPFVGASKDQQLQNQVSNFIPAYQPKTMLGREWEILGVLFGPMSDWAQSSEDEIKSDLGSVPLWAHFGLQAGGFAGLMLGGKGIGAATRTVLEGIGLKAAAKSEPFVPSPKRDEPKNGKPYEVRVPDRPHPKDAVTATEGDPASPKSDLFERSDEALINEQAARSDQRMGWRENREGGEPFTEDEAAFENAMDAQGDEILDYQRTLHDAAQARSDDDRFTAAQQAAERGDEVLRGGGPGHAGTPPGTYTPDWREQLKAMAALGGVDIPELALGHDFLEAMGKEGGEFDDLDTMAQEFAGKDPEGLTTMTPRGKAFAAELKAHQTLRYQYGILKRNIRSWYMRSFPKSFGVDDEANIAHVTQTMAATQLERTRTGMVNNGLRKMFAGMKNDDLHSWWQWYESGVALPKHMQDMADWDSIKSFYENIFARALQERQLAGDPIQPSTRSNYFPHAARPKDWTQRQSLVQSGHSRAFATMADMHDAGVEPLSLNPAVNFEYWQQAHSLAMLHAELRWQKVFGGLRVVDKKYVPKPNELTIDGPDGVTKLAGSANLVGFIENTVAGKPFMGWKSNFAAALRGFNILKNSAQAPILGFPSFHAIHEGVFVRPIHALTESLSMIDKPLSPSGVVDTMKALGKMFTTADRPVVNGVKMSARRARRIVSGKEGGPRFNPKTNAVEQPHGGDPFLDVMDVVRHGADPGILTTPGQELMRRMMVGGFVTHNPEWANEAAIAMRSAITDNTQMGYLRAAGWSIPAALRALAVPVMDHYVPLLKLRAYAADTERWKQANPGAEAGSPAERVAFSRIRREIDQRFGEANTSMMGWNRVIMAFFHGSMLSFGWNFGLLSQFGGGGKDAVQAMFDVADGQQRAKMRSRAMYASLYAGYACALGAMTMKAFSGKDAESLKDCIYPVVAIDKHGKEIREKLPTLMNDFGAEAFNVRDAGLVTGTQETVANKAAPIFSSLDMLFSGRDWQNHKISDPYDPWMQQVAQRFNNIMHNEIPWQWSQATRPVYGVTPHQAEGIHIAAAAGINLAPAYVTTPAPVEQIYRASAILGGSETYSSTQLYQAEARAGLRELWEDAKQSGHYGQYNIAERQFFQRWNATHPNVPVTMTARRDFRKRLNAPQGAMTLRDLQAEGQEHVWNSMQDYGDDMHLLAQYYRYFHRNVRVMMYNKMTPDQRTTLQIAVDALNAPTTPATSAPQG